ncbi:MAG TPA: VWA-like domain-containing protein [Ktedonobacterales bacterium]|nr:VWA-like domain-containing protein [Ktedonobacterales bacterium]
MDNAHDTLQRQITATILQLRTRSPFFATLVLFARTLLTETVPTAATDGRDIFLNVAFWNGLTPPQRLGLLAHEVLHAALLHVYRRGPRDPLLWNIAADIVVNGVILAQPGFELPVGHLREKSLEHLSVEEVYHLLQADPDKYMSVLSIVDLLLPSGLDQDGTAQQGYWRHALQQAQTLADMLGKGNLPAGLQREMTHLSPSQLDWRSYLWRFLVQTPTDFEAFDRRFIGQELYLETLSGTNVRVAVAVDTSGSVGGKEMALFLGEVRGILSAYPHLVAMLYYVDAACNGPHELTAQAELPAPVGGGGTDFRPFFQAVLDEQTNQRPALCIYLTDGMGTFPSEAPSIPTLWVLTPGGISAQQIPFGETVRLIPEPE